MMNICPRCGLELFGYNETCPGCGAPLKSPPAPQAGEPASSSADADPRTGMAPPPARSATPPPLPRRTLADFVSLRWFVGPDIIRVVYCLGLVLGSFYAVALPFMVDDSTSNLALELARMGVRRTPVEPNGLASNIVIAVIFFIIFNVLWRLSCESGLLMYKIHDHLAELAQSKRLR